MTILFQELKYAFFFFLYNKDYFCILDYKIFVLLMLLDQSFFSIKVLVDKLCYSWSFQRLACLQMFLFTLLAYVVSGYNYGITVLFPL